MPNVLVTLSDEVLEQLDELKWTKRLSRVALIQAAVDAYLGREVDPRATQKPDREMNGINDLPWDANQTILPPPRKPAATESPDRSSANSGSIPALAENRRAVLAKAKTSGPRVPQLGKALGLGDPPAVKLQWRDFSDGELGVHNPAFKALLAGRTLITGFNSKYYQAKIAWLEANRPIP